MGLRTWLEANRNDEREQQLFFRAGSAAYSVMCIALILLACAYLFQGRQGDALGLIGIMGLGQVVMWGLLRLWRVGR